MRIMKHYFAFVSRNRYIVQKKLKNIVVLGLKSKKVYETINSELSILGLFNHNRELLVYHQEGAGRTRGWEMAAFLPGVHFTTPGWKRAGLSQGCYCSPCIYIQTN